ncbi:MAG: glycerophosphodiester phosphodiesterase, partial [Gammaproteobacteria bacterium]
VDAAHSLGLQVIPYTVNRIKDLEYLIDIGVDGVITDYPNKFKDILDNQQIAY